MDRLVCWFPNGRSGDEDHELASELLRNETRTVIADYAWRTKYLSRLSWWWSKWALNRSYAEYLEQRLRGFNLEAAIGTVPLEVLLGNRPFLAGQGFGGLIATLIPPDRIQGPRIAICPPVRLVFQNDLVPEIYRISMDWHEAETTFIFPELLTPDELPNFRTDRFYAERLAEKYGKNVSVEILPRRGFRTLAFKRLIELVRAPRIAE